MTTPIWSQYLALKRRYPGYLLLFRLGDFYETFGEDAALIAGTLGITLTSREMGRGQRVPMAGIPHHALEAHLGKLIAAGHRLAVAEQLGEPTKGRGLVERNVTRVVTPGTVVEPGLLEERRPNYIAALVVEGARAGLAHADITTGHFATTQLPAAALATELGRLAPAEVLVPADQAGPEPAEAQSGVTGCGLPALPGGVKPTAIDARRFRRDEAAERLLRHLEVASLEGFGCADQPLAIRAAGALLAYLAETTPAALNSLDDLRTYSTAAFMALDEPTRRNLELTETARGRRTRGSLIGVLDATKTPMGGRLLRAWLSQPLLALPELTARQAHVAWFYERALVRDEVRALLGRTGDAERLANRAIQRGTGPRDLIQLKAALERLPELRGALGDAVPLPECADLARLIGQALVPEPPATLADGGVIAAGYAPDLDELRESTRDTREWMARLETSERARTGIRSLRVGYNRVFGYYLEVSHANRDAVPADYIRKQTLVGAERYVTPELKEREAQLLGAQERIVELETRLFKELVERVAAAGARLRAVAETLALVDAASALAHVAERGGWTRPALDEGDAIELIDCRHPVLESGGETVIPNDCTLSNHEVQLALITGPNMAGKSTYLRQVAVAVLLAQIGSYVPARSAQIGLVDRIFTRVGAQDDIAAGQSTFMVEMAETANILKHATPRSLLVFDEIGRGTSTYDGLAIARSVIEFIHNHPELGCKTLFATHYHELTELEGVLPRVRNFRVDVLDEGGEIVFLHKVVAGAADRSYGIHVARLAGVPRAVTRRAEEILRELEAASGGYLSPGESSGSRSPDGRPGRGRGFRARREQHDLLQLTFLGDPDPVVESLKALDVLSLSPLEALAKLYQLQEEARRADSPTPPPARDASAPAAEVMTGLIDPG